VDAVTVGVLVMAYGSPATPEEIEPYYTHIRRGRPATPEQLDDLRRRYDAVGGTSTLRARTHAQADALQRALGDGYRVALGMKHAAPFIEEGAADLSTDCDRIVGLVLAPHYSAMSVGEYIERAREAATVPFTAIESWATEPAYVDFLAAAVRDARREVPGATVLFTAHSLPARIVDAGDPYPDEIRATADAVAAAAGVDRYDTGWQSAGRTPEPWLGPDVLEVIDAADGPLVVCPCGFVSDHLEVAYDLDIEAAARAKQHGIAFARTRVLNDDETVLRALAERVKACA
jgi:ferrochelatase